MSVGQTARESLDTTLAYIKARRHGAPLEYPKPKEIFEEMRVAACTLERRQEAIAAKIHQLTSRLEDVDGEPFETGKIENARKTVECLEQEGNKLSASLEEKEAELDSLSTRRRQLLDRAEALRRKALKAGESSDIEEVIACATRIRIVIPMK